MVSILLLDAGQDVIDELHNNGKWVVCYINIGAIEEWRSDYEDFPEEAIGSPLEGWPDEYWLDVNNEVRVVLSIQGMIGYFAF